MKFSIFASILLTTSSLSLAQSTGNPVGQDAANPVKGKVDSDTQEAIEFADPGNATAKAFAAAIGVSIGEATSRLRSQARLARVVAELSAKHPDTFAGLKLEQRGN